MFRICQKHIPMIGFTLQHSRQTRSADTLFAADFHSDTGFVKHLYDGSTRRDLQDLAGAAQLYFEGSVRGNGGGR
jgi:hypothetical protein